MKKIMMLLFTLIILMTGCTTDTANTDTITSDKINETSTTESYETFYEDDKIHEIRVTITEEDFSDILDNPLDEAYHTADITLDGETLSNVGFRTKGNSTLGQVASSESERYSFKIKANKYEDQDLLGLDEFVLNNMFSDASYLREYISYEAMAANGLIVPLTSFVNVYINDELYGFYLLVESVDDSFLERNFGDNDGNLYRADEGTSLAIKNGEYVENVSQKNGDDESKYDLYALMDILNAMPNGDKGDIESVLDVDSVLRYIATNTLLENYDSLSGGHQQNYYLYNNDGVFVLIPWDFNMSFGGFGGSGQSTVDIDSPISGITEASPLISNLLAVDEYREDYYKILDEYMAYFSDFENDVTSLADMIRTYVVEDPSSFTTIELFESNVVYQEGGAVEVASMNDNKGGMGNANGARPAERDQNNTQKPPERIDDNQVNTDNPQGQMPGEDNKMNAVQKGSDVSIINVLLARIENIKEQLKSLD